jgi:hypothetical protein
MRNMLIEFLKSVVKVVTGGSLHDNNGRNAVSWWIIGIIGTIAIVFSTTNLWLSYRSFEMSKFLYNEQKEIRKYIQQSDFDYKISVDYIDNRNEITQHVDLRTTMGGKLYVEYGDIFDYKIMMYGIGQDIIELNIAVTLPNDVYYVDNPTIRTYAHPENDPIDYFTNDKFQDIRGYLPQTIVNHTYADISLRLLISDEFKYSEVDSSVTIRIMPLTEEDINDGGRHGYFATATKLCQTGTIDSYN